MPLVGSHLPDAGDIFWIDFGDPVGHEQGGRRPSVVLSGRAYNQRSSTLIVCPITRSGGAWPYKVAIPPVGRIAGFVMLDQIRVIDPLARPVRFAGRLPEAALAFLRVRLATLFDL